jgi:hypothetical protein
MFMDLTARKYKFIQEFMKIVNPKKIDRLEEILHEEINKTEIVAYTIDGNAITKEEYIKRNEDALSSFKKGNFKTQQEMMQKFTAK